LEFPGTNKEHPMKSLILAAAALLVGATSASAQFFPGPPPGHAPWARDRYPYVERHHSVCQEKAWRLRSYERRATADGRFDRREREIMRRLRWDLDRTCGRFRWHG
jgi:hypothetical protein